MKISQTGSGAPTERGRKSGRTTEANAGESFRRHIEADEPQALHAPIGSAPLAALGSLLAVQESPDPASERKRAVLQGDTLLDELKELQVGLVQGWVSEDTLRSLTHMLDQPRLMIDDPDLKQVLDDIELRAAVELAKVERQSS